MTRTKNTLWIAVAVIAVLDCAVYVSRAAKAPDKVAASTVFAIHTAFGARLCSSSALLPRSTAAASFLANERRSTRCRAKMNAVIAITRKRSGKPRDRFAVKAHERIPCTCRWIKPKLNALTAVATVAFQRSEKAC